MNKSKRSEEALFEELVRLPSPQRAAYLQEACGPDSALRQRLEILLAVHDRASDFATRGGRARGGPGRFASHPWHRAARRPDRPLQALAADWRGGCGVVYMAQQEAPVRRLVALKVIKPGMDTRQVVARFEAERQALALMDHPNIAKVLEAGATDAGRPFS